MTVSYHQNIKISWSVFCLFFCLHSYLRFLIIYRYIIAGLNNIDQIPPTPSIMPFSLVSVIFFSFKLVKQKKHSMKETPTSYFNSFTNFVSYFSYTLHILYLQRIVWKTSDNSLLQKVSSKEFILLFVDMYFLMKCWLVL